MIFAPDKCIIFSRKITKCYFLYLCIKIRTFLTVILNLKINHLFPFLRSFEIPFAFRCRKHACLMQCAYESVSNFNAMLTTATTDHLFTLLSYLSKYSSRSISTKPFSDSLKYLSTVIFSPFGFKI